jgi:hypothetical protein
MRNLDLLPTHADARHVALKLAALFLVTAALLSADGGSVLLRKQSGSFVITVFGTPRVGLTDFSVLVQNADTRAPVLDAEVDIRIAHNIKFATHEAAIDKLLYAALIKLPQAGKSHLEVSVTFHGQTTIIEGDVDVAPATPPWIAYWPYFAIVPAAILLFALNQWLKNKRQLKRLAAPP